jgi:ribosomal protein S18 acetylase RimI-like enzyme
MTGSYLGQGQLTPENIKVRRTSDIVPIVVNMSLPMHPIENGHLAKFHEQFSLDKLEQMPSYNQILELGVENNVATIHRNGKHLWMLKYNGSYIGFATIQVGTTNVKKCVTICDYFIDKPYRGIGLGRLGMEVVTNTIFQYWPGAERVGLSVLSANVVAKSLYSSMGFQPQIELMILEKG